MNGNEMEQKRTVNETKLDQLGNISLTHTVCTGVYTCSCVRMYVYI